MLAFLGAFGVLEDAVVGACCVCLAVWVDDFDIHDAVGSSFPKALDADVAWLAVG